MYRTTDERKKEVRIIIEKLTELKLTTIYEPIQELFRFLKMYVNENKSMRINIPFPSIRKQIVGYLPIESNKECWVKLTSDKMHRTTYIS